MIPEGVNVAHPDRLFIGGRWVPAHSGRLIDLISPNTEQVIGQVAEADEADMDAAVAAARAAFDNGPWPTMAPTDRVAAFRRMVAHLQERVPELAKAWTAQMGGLAGFAGMMHGGAVMELGRMADTVDAFQFVERVPSDHCAAALVVYEPVGVVVAISPWNGPFQSMSSKMAAAILAGCTVILKPSPETPLETYIIAEAAEAAGIPAGVINVVTGNREASDHLVCNPGVDKVSFTGSTAVGKRIGAVCAERVARCTLELGGKSAVIICDDFPIDEAAKILTRTITMMSGQICAMLSRAIVSRHRHDELAAAIAAEMAQIRIGHSDDPEAQLGPVAMKRQLDRIEMYIEEGKSTARLAFGGNRPAHLNSGYFIEPTLFVDVDNKSRIAQEEIFGPVLVLIPAEDEDDAIRIANDSDFGLGGSVMTKDHEKAYRLARRIRTGAVGQNGLRIPFGLPLGGFKQSGIGREGSVWGLLSHLELKAIMIDGVPAAL